MQRQHEKLTSKTFRKHFSNMLELANFTKSIPDEKHAADDPGRGDHWDGGVKTLDASLRALAVDGWTTKELDNASALKEAINARIQKLLPISDVVYDVYGDDPAIDRFIEGLPDDMERLEVTRHIEGSFSGVFKIGINCATPWKMESDRIIWRGLATMVLAEVVEQMGGQVQIDVLDVCSNREHDAMLVTSTTIKEVGQNMDIRRSMFAMACPAFFRRVMFRFQEQQEVNKRGFGPGRAYAFAVDVKEVSDQYDVYVPAMLDSNSDWTLDHDKTVDWLVERLEDSGFQIKDKD